MNLILNIVLSYISARLKEPSTWYGLLLILNAVGIKFSEELNYAVIFFAVSLAGGSAGVLLPDKFFKRNSVNVDANQLPIGNSTISSTTTDTVRNENRQDIDAKLSIKSGKLSVDKNSTDYEQLRSNAENEKIGETPVGFQDK